MPTASMTAISQFCKSVASRVSIPDIIPICSGAKINYRTKFVSCPDPQHHTTERHLTHCSYGGNTNRHTYHCFVCGASGDSVTYVARWLGISNFAAARLINDYFGLGYPDPCT